MKEHTRRGLYLAFGVLAPMTLFFVPLLLVVWKVGMPRRWAEYTFLLMIYAWMVSPWWDKILSWSGRKYRREDKR